jgi:hypothetical protein
VAVVPPVAPRLQIDARAVRALKLVDVTPLLVFRAILLVGHVPTVVFAVAKPVLVDARRGVDAIDHIDEAAVAILCNRNDNPRA